MLIGPKGGSCGTALYRREPVYVTDILSDPDLGSLSSPAIAFWNSCSVVTAFVYERRSSSSELSPFIIVKCVALTPPICS